MNDMNLSSPDTYSEILNKLTGDYLPVNFKYDDSAKNIKGKRILITGGAGSIGSAIAKKILTLHPEAIGLLDINESGLTDMLLKLNKL